MFLALREAALPVTLASVINDVEGVTGDTGPVAIARLDRRVPVVVGLHFAGDVQPAVGTRIMDLEHLIALEYLPAVPRR
jgi:hypothetical protein